jgi:glucokinase
MLSGRGRTPVLLGDIGGTNARFAVLVGGDLAEVEHVMVNDHPSFEAAVAAFLAGQRPRRDIGAAVLAIAGPVSGEFCAITNSPWMIDAGELCSTFGLTAVRLINDFEAVALSLPQLRAPDLFLVGNGKPQAGGPMLVLGPGTGFGAAALIDPDGRAIPIATEAGHATLPSASRREDAIIDHLRQRFGHVSVERVISGPGLENLYQAIAALDGARAPARNPNQITEAAIAGNCPVSRLALETFCAMLGTVAGNLALGVGARGGVYIAGGIAPRITEFLAQSEFRERFEAKGRFRGYLAAVPTSIIVHPHPTFVGLKALSEAVNEAAG